MQFINIVFWVFVCIVALLILIFNKVLKEDINKIKTSKLILLVASYIFVSYINIQFGIILLILTLVTWVTAQKSKYTKYGIIFSLIVLGYFKYTNFFIESISKLVGLNDSMTLRIVLPLGISFYTFSAISYIVDVSRNKISQKSLLDVALYLSFFPKITSGPIQRSDDFFNQISKIRNINFLNFSIGIQIFCFGLFKKIILADRLSIFVDQVYEVPLAFNSFTIFIAMISYSFQIYFDFSGYSDMAIGVAKILDIDLPKNFNLPYLAHNVTEFWKRWHITLSSWLQEYLYIPLGGNKKGKVRAYINLILTMLIGGLWHGSQWTFVFWGLLHGLALAIHKVWVYKTNSDSNKNSIIGNVISILITLIFVSFCWIFFRVYSISQAFSIIKIMLTMNEGIYHPYFWFGVALVIYFISIMFAKKHSKKNIVNNKKYNNSLINGYYPIQNLDSIYGLVVFFVFCGIILGLAYTGGSPFIYGAY